MIKKNKIMNIWKIFRRTPRCIRNYETWNDKQIFKITNSTDNLQQILYILQTVREPFFFFNLGKHWVIVMVLISQHLVKLSAKEKGTKVISIFRFQRCPINGHDWWISLWRCKILHFSFEFANWVIKRWIQR